MYSITVERGGIGVSDVGLGALPALIVFFVVSGFRAAFQVSRGIARQLLFKLRSRDGWRRPAVARLRVTVSRIAPGNGARRWAPLEILALGMEPAGSAGILRCRWPPGCC